MATSNDSLPIVRTKLYRPAVPSDLLPRDRLLSMMDHSVRLPLTLVSAPAGYGKTVLVSDWLQRRQHNFAWISLDPSDSGISQFLQYIIAAISDSDLGKCLETRSLLKLPELPPTRVIACHLLNDLLELDPPTSLVFDDYHLVSAASKVHTLIELLLEHPSPGISLVLITRRDPPMPLARLRAKNQVLDIRLQDLRFNQPETRQLLAGITSHEPTKKSALNLQRELEGWGAGLRLVSLGMRHCNDPDEFLQSLGGGLPEIQRYLLGEVLDSLPEAVSHCMLKTAELDRFCAPLVEYVCQPTTEKAEGERDLSGNQYVAELLNCNLFTLPLGTDGEWFRFHHLFQDLLQSQALSKFSASQLADFKCRASEWFEQNGFITDAIKYAIAAGNPQRAAAIIDEHRLQEFEADRWYVLAGWMELLPPEMRESTPGLLLARALIAHFQFDLDSLQTILHRIEMLEFSEELSPVMQAEIAHHKSAIDYWNGDIEAAAALNETALALYPEKPSLLRGEMLVYHGVIQQGLGRKHSSQKRILGEIAREGERSEVLNTRIYASATFVHLLSADASAVLNSTVPFKQIALSAGAINAESWADYTRGMAHLQSLSFDKAIGCFEGANQRQDFFEPIGARDNAACLVLALQLSNQPEKALMAADSLAACASSHGDPNCFAIADSCRARLALLQGQTETALAWARGFPMEFLPSAMFSFQEFPALTQARVFIMAGDRAMIGRAETELSSLQPELERLNNRCHLIEVLVLRSIAVQQLGDQQNALKLIEHALDIGVAGNWLRPFVEPGPLVAEILDHFSSNHRHAKAIARIHNSLETRSGGDDSARKVDGAAALGALDRLTHRELDILELLAKRLQNKEIAGQLFISTHTVKDHLKHIYQKLDVSNRRQAVTRSIEIGLIRRD